MVRSFSPMSDLTFLNDVVNKALKLFEYYRNGPVPMPELKPGFIFQQCVDMVLEADNIVSKEYGLGDHCLPELGLAVQLKTTVSGKFHNVCQFCRSSIRRKNVMDQKIARCEDVTKRVYEMLDATQTDRFVLSYVDLLHSVTRHYLLHDGNDFVGEWMNPEFILSPVKQTHFKLKLDKLTRLEDGA
jgi:hypothetical protein